jgi:peptide chain release factor 2
LRWQTHLEDINSAIALLQVDDDAALSLEAASIIDRLTQELNQWQFWHPYDQQNAQITITATAGGDDACDWVECNWVERLSQMYTQWAQRQGYRVNQLEVDGREQGPRTIAIKGRYAYGYLKQEAGVHQLRDRPPFAKKGKLQNYHATVEVAPILDQLPIEIPDGDWEVCRFPRYLGSSMIITSHGVRVTHRPTGLSCIPIGSSSSGTADVEQAIAILKTRLLGTMLNDPANRDRAIVRHYDWEHNQSHDLQL